MILRAFISLNGSLTKSINMITLLDLPPEKLFPCHAACPLHDPLHQRTGSAQSHSTSIIDNPRSTSVVGSLGEGFSSPSASQCTNFGKVHGLFMYTDIRVGIWEGASVAGFVIAVQCW
jgi:hypothetical protein